MESKSFDSKCTAVTAHGKVAKRDGAQQLLLFASVATFTCNLLPNFDHYVLTKDKA